MTRFEWQKIPGGRELHLGESYLAAVQWINHTAYVHLRRYGSEVPLIHEQWEVDTAREWRSQEPTLRLRIEEAIERDWSRRIN